MDKHKLRVIDGKRKDNPEPIKRNDTFLKRVRKKVIEILSKILHYWV